jgi:hypothetical protein
MRVFGFYIPRRNKGENFIGCPFIHACIIVLFLIKEAIKRTLIGNIFDCILILKYTEKAFLAEIVLILMINGTLFFLWIALIVGIRLIQVNMHVH